MLHINEKEKDAHEKTSRVDVVKGSDAQETNRWFAAIKEMIAKCKTKITSSEIFDEWANIKGTNKPVHRPRDDISVLASQTSGVFVARPAASSLAPKKKIVKRMDNIIDL